MDIHLFKAAPLPRLSVIDGVKMTFLSSASETSPNLSFSATRIASVSSVEIINEGRSPFSKIHENSSRVTSNENQLRAGNTSPASTRLCVHSRCAVSSSDLRPAWIVPFLCDLHREVLRYENHVSWDSSYCWDKLVEWSQEGSFMFERARHEHDTTQSLLKGRHMDCRRTRNPFRPPCEPLGATRSNTDTPLEGLEGANSVHLDAFMCNCVHELIAKHVQCFRYSSVCLLPA